MAVVLGNFAFGPPAAAANAERLTDKSSQVRRAAVLQVYEKHDQSLKSTITARHLRVAALTLRADPSPHFLAPSSLERHFWALETDAPNWLWKRRLQTETRNRKPPPARNGRKSGLSAVSESQFQKKKLILRY